MSTVVCGKRPTSIFADELLPPSPPSPHSSHHHLAAKRARRSPHRRREALLQQLLPLFPNMDPQVKLLLAGERQICDQVFDGVNFNKGHCFAELTVNSVVTLLSFGDAVARSKRSPEKLFVLLDMYEAMRELQSEIDTIFVGESCSQMRDSALSLTKCLAQTAQKTFSDFEEAVERMQQRIFIPMEQCIL